MSAQSNTISTLRTRFAPSPTGYLHLGHVAHALYVWGLAKRFGAEVLLRIEDHDRGRCRPEYELSLLDDLEWLGFAWDGPVTRQSERERFYHDAIVQLHNKGLIYGCDCSRKQILARAPQENSPELRYDNHCRERGLTMGTGMGWRCRIPEESVTFDDLLLGPQWQHPKEQCGDLLLHDRHGNWSYQFAVTVDDMLQDVNMVVRGEDLLASTGRQVLLAKLLGRKARPCFFHHPLIKDDLTDMKLSKRDLAHAVREERLTGQPPEVTLSAAARAVGIIQNDEVVNRSTLIHLVADEGTKDIHAKIPINP